MKAKKTRLTAATLSAFLAFGTSVLADNGGANSNAKDGGKKSIKSHKTGHHKGGKKSKKNSGGSTTTPPPK